MSVVMVVGSAATIVSLSSTVPQVLRAARTRSVEGVSWSGILLALATFTLWGVYAVAVADSIQVANNALALLLMAALSVVVLRAGAPHRVWPPVAVVLAAGAASFWLVDVADAVTLAMVGTAVSSLRMLPQARLAVSRAPLWGLCPWATVLAWVGSVLWLAYAVLAHDVPFAVCAFTIVLLQTVVAAYRLPPRRTLASLAGGRLGEPVARIVLPISVRLPVRQEDYKLAA